MITPGVGQNCKTGTQMVTNKRVVGMLLRSGLIQDSSIS